MKMNVTATVSHALGHWPRILPALGIQVLKNRHQPCPVCGGSDRFRFDDREGRGTWYCNQCGAGDGLKLVEKVFGVSPSDAAAKVAAVTGSLPPADPAVTAAAGAETDAARKNAAALAQTLMAKTRPGTGNAYLTRKGFPGRECRMLTGTHRAGGVSWRAGDLVVPLYDDSGELVNLQLISADGRKRTLKGGQVRGTCHILEGQNPMRFTDRSGGVSRRRVIIHFPEQIAPQERDPQLKDKITRELAVIVRHLMQKFSDPMLARSLLQSQQNSDEALNIKRDADPTFDFIGYLETLPQTSGMYMGNASIIPRNYRKYLYHAYLAYMEANGYRNVLSLKMFGLGLPVMLKEYGLNYEKRHTKQGIQTNLTLKEESYGDWLPKCDDPATT
ncbi:TPA: hypothetical protein O7M72_000688 [Escherichia coli]|nr:hypothetical protein [Escherichia coli]